MASFPSPSVKLRPVVSNPLSSLRQTWPIIELDKRINTNTHGKVRDQPEFNIKSIASVCCVCVCTMYVAVHRYLEYRNLRKRKNVRSLTRRYTFSPGKEKVFERESPCRSQYELSQEFTNLVLLHGIQTLLISSYLWDRIQKKEQNNE